MGTVRLDSLASVNPEALSGSTPSGFSFAYIDITSVETAKLNLDKSLIEFRDAPSRARRIVRSRDIVMSTVRPNLKAFAYCGPLEGNVVASTGFAVLRVVGDNDPRFLFHSILSDPVAREIESHCVGSNYPAINSVDVKRLQVPNFLPKQQTAIANVLSALDTQIEATEGLIAKQERVRAGLMQDLFTRGVDEHGQLRPPRAQAPHLYYQTELGWLPLGWEVTDLDDLVRVIDCKHYTPVYVDEGYPVLRPRNVKADGLDFVNVDYVTESDFRAMTDMYRPKRGDIIFSRNASFGISSRVETDVEFAIGQDVIVMAQKVCDLGYVFHSLRSDSVFEQIAKVSSGSTFGRINLGEIRKLKIAAAKPEERTLITDCLDKSAGCRADLAVELEVFRRLKSGLMQDLLTGKVSVAPLLEEVA